MARNFIYPNTGARGVRRIVPMMGIDYIAGQIEKKGTPNERYGKKPASMGGRTRRWSFVNFLNIDGNAGRSTPVTAAEQIQQQKFSTATASMRATFLNLSVLTQVQNDFYVLGTTYFGVNPSDYATIRGWVMAIRYSTNAPETANEWPPIDHTV